MRERERERKHLQLENLGGEPVGHDIVKGVHDDLLGAGQVPPAELLHHLGQGVDHGADVELLQPSLRQVFKDYFRRNSDLRRRGNWFLNLFILLYFS